MAEKVWNMLAEFSLSSAVGNEREAIRRVAAALRDEGLTEPRLARLETAVGEATMNAMEHGNHYNAGVPVVIGVYASPRAIAVRITDQGEVSPLPNVTTPDLEAKLSGVQSPRGWGLYLIRNMVDEMRVLDGAQHTVELVIRRTE